MHIPKYHSRKGNAPLTVRTAHPTRKSYCSRFLTDKSNTRGSYWTKIIFRTCFDFVFSINRSKEAV
jgi:hypothetical protein